MADIINKGILHYHDKKYDEYFKALDENKVIKKARKIELAEKLEKLKIDDLMSDKVAKR